MATRTIGVREFRDHASEVLKRVETGAEAYNISRNGRVIARLVPARQQGKNLTVHEWLAAMQQIAEEIGREIEGPFDAVEAVRQQRRHFWEGDDASS